MPASLSNVLTALRRRYGKPVRVEPRGAFAMVLFELASSGVDEAAKAQVYAELCARAGTTPDDILRATKRQLTAAIAKGGGLPAQRADRVRRAAELASQIEARAGVSLDQLVKRDPLAGKLALKKLPGLGEPGAEKIVTFAGGHRALPLDSNGLRVLLRLGFAPDRGGSAVTQAAVQDALAEQLPKDPIDAHLLLRTHGVVTCKRTRPLCPQCPLVAVCPSAVLS